MKGIASFRSFYLLSCFSIDLDCNLIVMTFPHGNFQNCQAVVTAPSTPYRCCLAPYAQKCYWVSAPALTLIHSKKFAKTNDHSKAAKAF